MKKFKIPSVPPTTNRCIRFPNNIIEEIEDAKKKLLKAGCKKSIKIK